MDGQDPIPSPKAIIKHALRAVCCCAMCLALKEAEEDGGRGSQRTGRKQPEDQSWGLNQRFITKELQGSAELPFPGCMNVAGNARLWEIYCRTSDIISLI